MPLGTVTEDVQSSQLYPHNVQYRTALASAKLDTWAFKLLTRRLTVKISAVFFAVLASLSVPHARQAQIAPSYRIESDIHLSA